MATTATIEFSNEKKTGTFKYVDGGYTVSGTSAADLVSGDVISANGTIVKDDVFVGNFYANRVKDEVKVNISDVKAEILPTLSPIVSACLAKVVQHYA